MDALSWHEDPGPLREPVLVAAFRGWNDAAAAASAAVEFLRGALATRKVGSIDPEEFCDFQATRPTIDLSQPGAAIAWPEWEIDVAVRAQSRHDLVLLAGPEPSFRWRTFVETVMRAVDELGVRRVVSLGALLADVPHTRPITLTGIASSERLVEGLGTRAPTYQGPTGIVGVLYEACTAREIDSISLWAPVPHYVAGVANPSGALALLAGLEGVLDERFETAALARAATEHRREIDRAVQRDQRLQGLVEQLEQAADDAAIQEGTLPSGDALAQELERFLRGREGGDQAPPAT